MISHCIDNVSSVPSEPRILQSPVDELLPICQKLVKDVEAKLKEIVEGAIEACLATFPSLKLAVKTRSVLQIFETKRSETEVFIKQFVQMQKKSVDHLAVKIPLPDEITQWKSCYVSLPHSKPATTHPVMNSPMMSQLNHLSQRLYPEEVLEKINETSLKGSYRVRRHARMRN